MRNKTKSVTNLDEITKNNCGITPHTLKNSIIASNSPSSF